MKIHNQAGQKRLECRSKREKIVQDDNDDCTLKYTYK